MRGARATRCLTVSGALVAWRACLLEVVPERARVLSGVAWPVAAPAASRDNRNRTSGGAGTCGPGCHMADSQLAGTALAAAAAAAVSAVGGAMAANVVATAAAVTMGAKRRVT
eukprot:4808038-Prymnesium_polylepis.1